MISVIRDIIGYFLLAIYIWIVLAYQFPMLVDTQLIGMYVFFLILAFGVLVLASNYMMLLVFVLGSKWLWLRRMAAILVIQAWLARYDFGLISSHTNLMFLVIFTPMYFIWWSGFDYLGKAFEIHGEERRHILLRDPPQGLLDLFPFHVVMVFFLLIPIFLPFFHK